MVRGDVGQLFRQVMSQEWTPLPRSVLNSVCVCVCVCVCLKLLAFKLRLTVMEPVY
jgi:hypothetical protein